MEIKNLPKKYEIIWEKCQPLFQETRPGDDEHAAEVVKLILEYSRGKNFDLDVLIPVAMMHDIGHARILPEHFKYVTGIEKLTNGKLVHMLAGAKIAKDILESCNYDPKKTEEIVEIISTHDGDLIKEWGIEKAYDTETKKIFHDIDCLDRYNNKRIENLKKMFGNSNDELLGLLRDSLKSIISPEFKKIAEEKMKALENE